MVDDWLLALKSKQSRKPLQSDIKNKILAAFRHIMKEAEDRGYVERDPSTGIPPFRDLSKQNRKIFSVEELQAMFPQDTEQLLDIWLTREWLTYFFILASTGLRPGEVSALTWGDWIRSKGGLIVSAAIEAITRERKCTKTGAIMPIPLTKRAGEMLLLLESSTENTHRDSLIFNAPDGRPLHLNTIGKHFLASLKRAGIPHAGRTTYSLRHSFDTHAMKLLDTGTVQELMGHKTMKMTMQTYYHPTDEDRLEALPDGIGDKLGKLWE
jgi:integrase